VRQAFYLLLEPLCQPLASVIQQEVGFSVVVRSPKVSGVASVCR
jgi:hypothetical protein